MPPDGRKQLLHKESQKTTTEQRQEQIVGLENGIKLERLSLLHQFPAAENDDIVCEQYRPRLFQRRHWRHTGSEAEILREEVAELQPYLLEERPHLDAERAVECRQGYGFERIGRHDGPETAEKPSIGGEDQAFVWRFSQWVGRSGSRKGRGERQDGNQRCTNE